MKPNLLLLYSFILCWTGCIDEIKFDRPDTIDNGIAIQGKLTKGNPSTIRVSIRKLFDFQEGNRLLNVRSVELVDELGNQKPLTSQREGLYEQTIIDFPINYGVGYKIRVVTFDQQVFESSFEQIFPAPTPSKLVEQLEKREITNAAGGKEEIEVLTFRLDTPLNGNIDNSNSRILWEFESTFKILDEHGKECFITSSPFQNYISFDGTTSSKKIREGIPLYETVPISHLKQGYYFSVFQQSLSETAFNYWSQVQFINNRSGTIFELPVGKITTNFTNVDNPEEEIFGFFYATEEKAIRTFVNPDLIKHSGDLCGPCDCSSLGGSSTKPDWWRE